LKRTIKKNNTAEWVFENIYFLESIGNNHVLLMLALILSSFFLRMGSFIPLYFLADCSILELSILVCMKRLEVKEQNSYNFSSVMKGHISHLVLLLHLIIMFFIFGRVQKHAWIVPDIWLLRTKFLLMDLYKYRWNLCYECSTQFASIIFWLYFTLTL
jgi:hypothetical protein